MKKILASSMATFSVGAIRAKFVVLCLMGLTLHSPVEAQSPGTLLAYVAHGSPTSVSVIDTTSNTVVATVPGGTHSIDVAVTPDGSRVYSTNPNVDTVSVIDTLTNTVIASEGVGVGPVAVAITPDGTRAYVVNRLSDSVSVIDTTTNRVVETIGVGSSPIALAITPDGTKVYVSNAGTPTTLSVIDTTTNTVSDTIMVRTSDVAITADGTLAYVLSLGANILSVIDTTTHDTIDVFFFGAGTWPAKIALTSDGTRAYVTNLLLDTVSVIDTRFPLMISAEIAVGVAPVGIAITPDETRVYVTNNDDSSVSVIDTSNNTVVTTIPVAFRPSGIAFTFGSIELLLGKLIDDVIALDLPQGTGVSLVAKLQQALAVLSDANETNDGSAVSLLQSFIFEVSALSDVVISADALIAQAQQIIDLLTA